MKAREETKKDYRKDLLIGVMASILASAILWTSEWLFKVVPQIGNALPVAIENIVYTKAASVTVYTPFLLTLRLATIIVLTAIFLAVFILATQKLHKKELERDESIAADTKEKTRKSIENITPTTAEQQANYIRKIRRKTYMLKKKTKRIHIRILLLIEVTVLLAVFLLGIFIIFVQKPIELKKNFDLELQIISPYVDDSMITKLKSDWVLMYSKEQYREIYTVIDKILEEHRISRYEWSTTKTIISGQETPAPAK